MRKVIKEYARKILADHGCNEYTYGTTEGTQILRDLKEVYPNGMEYPYIDVANAIIAISKRKQIKKSTWCVSWDNGSCCDGYDTPSLAQGKQDALDTLIEWMCQEQSEWNSDTPTGKEADHWNYMIYNCSACVSKYDPDTDEYHEYWEPSDKDLERTGWKTIKIYTIKPEHIDKFGPEATDETIITEYDVKRLADEWDMPVTVVLSQLDPYDW